MGSNYLNELLEMITKINDMTDINEKVESIYRLSSYCSYLYYSGSISRKEFLLAIDNIKDDPEEKLFERDRDNALNEIIFNNDLIDGYYRKYIDIYNNTFIPIDNGIVIDANIYKLFRDFLRYMGCEDLYFSLLGKKKISFKSILDHSVCINDRFDSYIVVSEKNKFDRYFSMSHEIAHAYENRIMCNYKSYFESTYNSEILSILFNRIFKEFISNKGILTNEDMNSLNIKFEANYYNFLLQALFITEIVATGRYKIFDYDLNMQIKNITINCNLTDHNYAIGSVISLILLNEWRKNDRLFISKLPETIKEIRNMNLGELLKLFDRETMVEDEIKRLIIKK